MYLDNILQQIGLSSKEAEVYLALLPRGKAPASLLAKHLQLPRSTVKFTCEQLVQKHLLRETVHSKTTFYVPEEPEKLLELLNRKQQVLEASKEELERNMAALSALYNPGTTLPKVRFYEGQDALIEMFHSLGEMKTPRYAFSAGDYMATFLPQVVENYRKQVAKNQQPVFALRGAKFKETVQDTHTKYFKNLEELKVHFLVTGDILAIGSIDPSAPIGILIEHGEIAEAFRAIFQDVWEQYNH